MNSYYIIYVKQGCSIIPSLSCFIHLPSRWCKMSGDYNYSPLWLEEGRKTSHLHYFHEWWIFCFGILVSQKSCLVFIRYSFFVETVRYRWPFITCNSNPRGEYTEVEQMIGAGQIPWSQLTQTLKWAHILTTADQVVLNACQSVCQSTCLPAGLPVNLSVLSYL